jgi:prepilin-type N-terminal cleavage/methylation domain-containing protein
MRHHYAQEGFTAVELLITLIIASMFIIAGFQLYSQVTRDGAEANKVAIVSNKVNERLQNLMSDSAVTCTTTRSPQTITETGVGPVTYTTTISCPNPSVPTLKLLKVEASYNNNAKKLQHAAYSN